MISVVVVEDVDGFFHLSVVADGVFDDARLSVIFGEDFLCKVYLQFFAVVVEVTFQVVGEFGFEGVEFGLGIFVVAFETDDFLEVGDELLTLPVVFEATLKNALLELVEVLVGEFKGCRCRDGGVFGYIEIGRAHV